MWKNTILLILPIFIISCHKADTFSLNDNIDEFDNIVKAVIENDSMKVFKNDKENYVIIEYLEKQEISVPKENKIGGIIQIAPPGELSIKDLFHLWQVDSSGFDKKDSLYLLSQNLNPDSLRINDKLLSKIKHYTRAQTFKELDKGNYLKYFTFSIPILSKDKSKAYIEIGYHCGGLCGNGKAYFLEKKDGKWKVIKKWETWIS